MADLQMIFCIGLAAACLFFFIRGRRLAKTIERLQVEVQEAQRKAEQSLIEAQKLVDQQIADLQTEAERVRQHYEAEARKVTDLSQAELAKALTEAEELRKYASMRDAEQESRRVVAEAIAEATALRTEAQSLLKAARTSSESEHQRAAEKAKSTYEQADARLNQAIRDAGRIVAEAEKKAKDVAGEAYDAMRDKQLLEGAAAAMRNIIEGYGDRYIIPTHSILDDLAAEFGYTSAGESLKSARAQSRRMVEQGEAATCEYVEASRRGIAIRFVVDAFNGRVDAILSRVKRDNHGVLEQEIRDAFSLVNLNGRAFRDARILDAYLEARLAELKWAVVVQELARKQLEEQRELKARMRDEEKARREYEQQLREAAREEEIRRKALEEKESELALAKEELEKAAAQDRAKLEEKVAAIEHLNEGLRKDLEAATTRALTIAQQTKKGHVYVISNIGAFGENVYKIGQTRRLNKQDRIDELGDASVPFDFDVHAWIESENAPALEHKLQRRFLDVQMNKINARREFYRVSLKQIREEIARLATTEAFTVTHWTDAAAATQYRESVDIESNREKLDKWLKRQQAIADRELRLDSLRLTPADVSALQTEDAGA